MPTLPVPLLPSLRQKSWGTHPLTRPSNIFRCNQLIVQLNPRRTLVWWKLKLETLRKMRAQKHRLSDQFWKAIPPFIDKKEPRINLNKREALEAELKRWNGRRSLFLSNYKERRDAAYAKGENRGLFTQSISLPFLDDLFTENKKLSRYACAPNSIHNQRRFGKGVQFTMDTDFNNVRRGGFEWVAEDRLKPFVKLRSSNWQGKNSI